MARRILTKIRDTTYEVTFTGKELDYGDELRRTIRARDFIYDEGYDQGEADVLSRAEFGVITLTKIDAPAVAKAAEPDLVKFVDLTNRQTPEVTKAALVAHLREWYAPELAAINTQLDKAMAMLTARRDAEIADLRSRYQQLRYEVDRAPAGRSQGVQAAIQKIMGGQL